MLIPRATTHRWLPTGTEPLRGLRHRGQPATSRPPRRYLSRFGQLLEHAPYCERDLHGPARAAARRGRRTSRSRQAPRRPAAASPAPCYVAPQPPVRRRRLGRLPLPVHLQRRATSSRSPAGSTSRRRRTRCSRATTSSSATSCPRKVDYHPLADPGAVLPLQRRHRRGDVLLRRRLRGAQGLRHRAGLGLAAPRRPLHGPQPGAVERSIGAEFFDELAVMVDTFRPLELGDGGRACEDPGYAWTWSGAGRHEATGAIHDSSAASVARGTPVPNRSSRRTPVPSRREPRREGRRDRPRPGPNRNGRTGFGSTPAVRRAGRTGRAARRRPDRRAGPRRRGRSPTTSRPACVSVRRPGLNPFLAAGPAGVATGARAGHRVAVGTRAPAAVEPHLLALAGRSLHLPFEVADYVDFYASEHHADERRADLPARRHRPAAELEAPADRLPRPGRHGRRVGHRRWSGRSGSANRPTASPCVGPTTRLDLEAEVGFVVGVGTALGTAGAGRAFADHVFGAVLVNDWSARDLQAWEYVPLGPVPRQVVRHLGLAVGGAAGRAGGGAGRAAGTGGAAARLPARRRAVGTGPEPGGRDERAGGLPPAVPADVLDAGPAARAPDRQRREPAHRRPVRLGHGQRPEPRPAGLPARAHLERDRATDAAGRQLEDVPGRRRRGGDHRHRAQRLGRDGRPRPGGRAGPARAVARPADPPDSVSGSAVSRRSSRSRRR